MITTIAFEVMVDFVTIGKPKITRKFSLSTALTLKPYNIWYQNSIWVNVSVGPMQALSFIQICDNHYFCVDLTWNDPIVKIIQIHVNAIELFPGLKR